MVIGVPLLHFTPWRIVKVIDLPSGPNKKLVASHGYLIVGLARSNW